MLRLSVLALAVILAPFLPAAGQSIVGPGLLAKQGIIVVDGAVLDGKVYVHTLPARWDRAPKWFVSRDGRFTALTGKVSTQREYETRQCMSASGARLEAQGRLVGESGLVVLGPGGNKAVVWTAAKALGPIKTPGCIQPTRAGLIPDRDWRSYGFRVDRGRTAGGTRLQGGSLRIRGLVQFVPGLVFRRGRRNLDALHSTGGPSRGSRNPDRASGCNIRTLAYWRRLRRSGRPARHGGRLAVGQGPLPPPRGKIVARRGGLPDRPLIPAHQVAAGEQLVGDVGVEGHVR